MSRLTHARASLAAAILVALVCAIGVYLYLSSGAEDSPHVQRGIRAASPGMPPPPQGSPWERLHEAAPPVADDDRALSSAFAVMRGRPERMPPRFQDKLIAMLGAPADELELRDAQRVHTVVGDAWVVYGRGVVCVFQVPEGNVGCDPVKVARKHGVALGVGNLEGKKTEGLPSDFLLVGIAPDWARRVRVRVGESDMRNVPVRNNVYSLREAELMVVKRLER